MSISNPLRRADATQEPGRCGCESCSCVLASPILHQPIRMSNSAEYLQRESAQDAQRCGAKRCFCGSSCACTSMIQKSRHKREANNVQLPTRLTQDTCPRVDRLDNETSPFSELLGAASGSIQDVLSRAQVEFKRLEDENRALRAENEKLKAYRNKVRVVRGQSSTQVGELKDHIVRSEHGLLSRQPSSLQFVPNYSDGFRRSWPQMRPTM